MRLALIEKQINLYFFFIRQTRWDHGLRINHLDDITCGLLPTLQVLASRGCECQGSICIVPIDLSTDSASHLQITLLEAYCREIHIEVVKITIDDLKFALGNHNYNKRDLSCVLVPRDMIYTNFHQTT